jgi:hypothetical protein
VKKKKKNQLVNEKKNVFTGPAEKGRHVSRDAAPRRAGALLAASPMRSRPSTCPVLFSTERAASAVSIQIDLFVGGVIGLLPAEHNAHTRASTINRTPRSHSMFTEAAPILEVAPIFGDAQAFFAMAD